MVINEQENWEDWVTFWRSRFEGHFDLFLSSRTNC